jgi:NADH-quinone oxidoreductase subunit N
VLFGALSSGFMLYGLSLVVGLSGGTSLEAVRVAVAAGAASQPAFVAAVVLVFAGFAFKVSAVPFQFWVPDVYQGAPTAVGGFLAVASKAAGFAALVRVAGAMGATASAGNDLSSIFPNSGPFVLVLGVSAVLTMTVGNLAACRQEDLKRLLAYSSIAQAGYMLMALAVWTPMAVEALVFYLVAYLFMNLAAFLVAGLIIRETGSSSMSSMRGLGSRRPWLAASFAIVMLSLTGIPPMFGFVGKLILFRAVIDQHYLWLAVIGLLNGAISLYYYAKPMLRMYLEDGDPVDADTPAPRLEKGAVVLACALVVPVVGLILYWGPLFEWLGGAVPSIVGATGAPR